MTPITYQEAATMLGVDNHRIRAAVSRDVLTQAPSGRYTKFVYKEQVQLFVGKPELSKRLLSADERQIWEQCATAIKPRESEVPQGTNFIPALIKMHVDRTTLEGTPEQVAAFYRAANLQIA